MVQQFFTTLTNTQFLVFSLFKDIRQEVNVSKSTEKKKKSREQKLRWFVHSVYHTMKNR